MINTFARSDFGYDHVFFRPQLPRNEHKDRLADGFCRHIAENSLCALIPGRGNAAEVFADNRVV